MTVVAVTRGGAGDPWLFESREEADLHPLVQYGDAVLAGPEDVLSQYGLHQLPVLLRVVGDDHLSRRVATAIPDWGVATEAKRREAARQLCGAVFEALARRARTPPQSPARVCELIRTDREKYTKERRMPEVNPNAGKPAAAGTGNNKGATTAKSKPTSPKRAPRYAEDHVITLLADAEGKKYGKGNNPKRAGSATATRFEAYKDGMTVKKAQEAGITVADLDYDIGKKYVKVGPKT